MSGNTALARPLRTGLDIGALTLALAALVAAGLAFGAPALGAAPALIAGLGGVLCLTGGLALAGLYHRHGPVDRRFGAANAVTAARGAAVMALVAAAATAAEANDPARWALCALAALALATDGVDGWLARRRGRVSAFGARFDMEVDAALMLAVGLLVWRLDIAGPWVLLIGLWRFGFIALAAAFPWLRAPLPPSLRRKTLCVAPLVLLIAALAPILPPALAVALAAAALALITISFAIDIHHLARRRSAS